MPLPLVPPELMEPDEFVLLFRLVLLLREFDELELPLEGAVLLPLRPLELPVPSEPLDELDVPLVPEPIEPDEFVLLFRLVLLLREFDELELPLEGAVLLPLRPLELPAPSEPPDEDELPLEGALRSRLPEKFALLSTLVFVLYAFELLPLPLPLLADGAVLDPLPTVPETPLPCS